jgi:ADP-ribosylglycohydrolase
MISYNLHDRIAGAIFAGTLGDSIGGVTEMMHYKTIERLFTEVTGPRPTGNDPAAARFDAGMEAGRYTDDTRLKFFFIDAISENPDMLTSDKFGHYFSENISGWYYTPVVNSYYKIWNNKVRPREAGRGNMGSNSTAMAIAPIGIMNACNPAEAARTAYDVASVIHESYSLDAAASMAAAVAEALKPNATVDSVVEAATAYLDRDSTLTPLILQAVELARNAADFKQFRADFYEHMTMPWPQEDLTDTGPTLDGFYTTCEPRETIPSVFGILVASNGDPKMSVLNAANFGRDSDSIGSMVGAIAGALNGPSSIPTEWIDTVDKANEVPMSHYVDKLYTSLTEYRTRQIEIMSIGRE